MNWANLQVNRIAFHFSAHETFDGINLYCLDGDEKEMFFDTVTKALKLLQAHDLRRYVRAKTYLKNIALLPSGNGHYERGTSSFFVDSFDYYRTASFASDIVHEATHGLLITKGFKYEADQKRHETICTQEQVRTIRRLIYALNPDMPLEKKQSMVKVWEDWMKTSLEGEWWGPQKQLRRSAARLISISREESTTPQSVYLVIREKERGHTFVVRNSTPYDATVTIKLSDIENARVDAPSPWTSTLHPTSQIEAFTAFPIDSFKPMKYQHKWNWEYGVPGATHDDSYRYGFPFDKQLLDESSNGQLRQYSTSRWDLPIGTHVSAARNGLVISATEQTESFPSQIIVKHGDGTFATYRGFAVGGINAKEGQRIEKADLLGVLGDKYRGSVTTFYFYVWNPIDGEKADYPSIKYEA